MVMTAMLMPREGKERRFVAARLQEKRVLALVNLEQDQMMKPRKSCTLQNHLENQPRKRKTSQRRGYRNLKGHIKLSSIKYYLKQKHQWRYNRFTRTSKDDGLTTDFECSQMAGKVVSVTIFSLTRVS